MFNAFTPETKLKAAFNNAQQIPANEANALPLVRSNSLRLAYLISRYPAVSHTFILREVLHLRGNGAQIFTASINAHDLPMQHLPKLERTEAEQTFYIKQAGIRGALLAHAKTLLSNFPGWLRGMASVLKYSLKDIRATVRNIGYFTESLMLGQWMRQQQVQHLHVHFATAAANVGLYVKQVFNYGLSLTVHGPDEFDNVGKECLPEKFAAADFIVCIGRFAQSQVMRQLPSNAWHKIEVCPLGVDTRHYLPAIRQHVQNTADTTRAASTTELTEPSAVTRILCVGRLCTAKGQLMLIKAAELLVLQGRNFHICMVGSGPEMANLQAYVHQAGLQAHIEFTGALSQQRVLERYARADIFVLPSFAEGIPVVLMEAMACGLPCIASRIHGIAELIRTHEEGMLVPPADCDALSNAIADLIDHPEKRTRIGIAARARVVRDFDLRRNCQRLQGVFQQRQGYTS